MSSLALALCVLLQSATVAPPDSVPHIGSSHIAEQTTYFTINADSIEGADPLLKSLDASHFVALGELHNRTRLGDLTIALLHYLHPRGFRNFAVETGPYSAEKLERLIGRGKEAVTKFHDRYSSKLFNLYPIPFFTGKADLEVLATANALNYDLWGLDQEFSFSFKYLVDELAALGGETLTREQQTLREEISDRLYWWNRREQIFSDFNLNCRLKQDDQFQFFLQSFEESESPRIVRAIRTSLDIYCRAERGEGSSRMRIGYIKENFRHHYERARAKDPAPKVLLKMGSFHAGRQKSPLGLYDIGHHLHRLADSTGQTSVHLRYLNRYYKGSDMMGREGWENSTHFMSVGRRERWALIDLRPLRRLIAENALQGSDYEEREIRNYDFVIIPPKDDKVDKHY